ncbi:hypothetical protein E3P99_00720 [Wallemia hederae]|uniref:Nickel/cobalt efflux system n=1 Tax=Wallemia hederae TaxID=1540922 RepID=A0A4V4LTX9_9BASI|nr:hypothetical protein E3P99_00720 [Wallemia hederae]
MIPSLYNCQTTILTRAVALLSSLVLLNVFLWIIAAFSFSGRLLSLALVAWTLGLRHGLDSDHIASIDNSIRQLSSRGIYPVSVGFFFAAGHSTVVLVVTIALIAGAQVYDNLEILEDLGGVIGGAVSSAFLFILGAANSVTLYQAIQSRKAMERGLQLGGEDTDGSDSSRDTGRDIESDTRTNQLKSPSFLYRIFSPVLTWVDRPSKLLLVGMLFSLGFDTSSSIVLLSVSALAAEDAQSPYAVLLFPLLFASGMILVDSLDNVMMVVVYTPRTAWEKESKLKLSFGESEDAKSDTDTLLDSDISHADYAQYGALRNGEQDISEAHLSQQKKLDLNKYTIVITALSVSVALGISVIQIMGLVVDNCDSCNQHMDQGDWIGKWWSFWVLV